ncbi:metal ABC transporter ATP-binding protein [Corynebacterium auris]|uniref:metal ABC transporter ATP-binding protein n=1 Tax=Corynebacterium auris TaxID=44750 RepID=UPI0025B30A36|nr:metal ABC transporter ATP-binding protein [Corynebacterium auris]WJY68773.1 putative ABC transporter ATP-binding protein [Corynebacterium auris]
MIARLIDATVEPLWSNVNLDIAEGEMIAVLGPNGSGKSTLLNCLAGIRRLQSGRAEVNGRLGFIPQQRMFDQDLPLRARDLVSLSLGHGILRNRRANRARVDELLASVGASHLADARVGALSGGQQQLVRQAQALAKRPEILLADEPFLSLDVAHQRETVQRFRSLGAAVLMVTHSIDPVVDVVDRILYIGPQGHVLGPVSEVLDSDVLSDLYGAPVDVVTVRGKTVIV